MKKSLSIGVWGLWLGFWVGCVGSRVGVWGVGSRVGVWGVGSRVGV